MEIKNRDRVRRVLDELREGLKPFVERRLRSQLGRDWRARLDANWLQPDGGIHWDCQALLSAMDEFWEVAFREERNRTQRSWVIELLEIRNSSAHEWPFSDEDTYRALDTAQRLLRKVGASQQAAAADAMRQEMLSTICDQSARTRVRQRATGAEAKPQPPESFAVRFQNEYKILVRLTKQQNVILDFLTAHQRAAIEGAAGTGKTLLAMEKARRLALEGQRVLLLCFNRLLAQNLRAEAKDFKVDVETFHGFQHRLARDAGLGEKDPSRLTPDERRRFYNEESPIILLDALKRLPDKRYDAIVVDEAQDFLPDWWDCLNEALHLGNKGTLYAFYDPNQNIYGGGPPDALEVRKHLLLDNCRNTKQIARYIASLVEAETRVQEEAPEGKPVETIPCANDAEVAAAVVEWLDRLVLREDVSSEEIAIVSTCKLQNSPFGSDRCAGGFQLVGLNEREPPPGSGHGKREVVFETLDRFKGLERDVVILLDLPSSREITANHLYVAASRARNLLIVVRREP